MRNGYYYRWCIDLDIEDETIVILNIPVARFICKSIKKPKHNHRTFSLLPDTLIPYNRISICLLIYILQLKIDTQSSDETLNEIDSISPEDILISEKTLLHLLALLQQTRLKLIHFFLQYPDSNRSPPGFRSYTTEEIICYIVNYPVPDNEHPLCGAYHLSVWCYKIQGSHHKNARFLFGTASQH